LAWLRQQSKQKGAETHRLDFVGVEVAVNEKEARLSAFEKNKSVTPLLETRLFAFVRPRSSLTLFVLEIACSALQVAQHDSTF